jgi:hypothetical protein
MNFIRSIYSSIKSWGRSDDPLVEACNFIILVVVGNQPFYPIYVRIFVGDDGWSSLWTFVSTPFFLVIPWIGRRYSVACRAMLPIVGALNSFLCAKTFGQASGVELFLCPCAMIAAMTFRAEERRILLSVTGALFVAFVTLHDRYGAPLHRFTPEEYGHFVFMNALSVGALIAIVGIQYSEAFTKERQTRGS